MAEKPCARYGGCILSTKGIEGCSRHNRQGSLIFFCPALREGILMKVKEIMTAEVVTVVEGTTVEEAAQLLTRHRLRGLPVVNQSGTLIGIVTEYELVSQEGHTVGDIMNRGVISISPETEVEYVSYLLSNRQIRCLTVVDEGQVVGLITPANLVQQIAMRWICPVCGERVGSVEAPTQCPRCHGSREGFTQEIIPPGV
jgi:predicted transcriptional regulator